MVNVHCLNNIASVGLDLFSDDYNMESSYEDAQAVLVRSAAMHDMEFADNLLIRTPNKNLSCKEVDNRNREHIA